MTEADSSVGGKGRSDEGGTNMAMTSAEASAIAHRVASGRDDLQTLSLVLRGEDPAEVRHLIEGAVELLREAFDRLEPSGVALLPEAPDYLE